MHIKLLRLPPLWTLLCNLLAWLTGAADAFAPGHGALWAQETSSEQALPVQEITRTPEGVVQPSLVPMPILFRQPETGTGFGSAATYFFRLGSQEDSHRARPAFPSTLTAVAIYTTHSQIITAIEPNLRLQGDRLRIGGAVEYVRFPTSFWGIGNDTGDEVEESYTARAFNLEVGIFREIRAGWYIGPVGRYARRKLSDVEPDGLLERRAVPGPDGEEILGLGMGISRDTRDRSTSPSSGGLHQLHVMRFDGGLGSDFDYTQIALDFRIYLPFTRGRVLALRLVGESLTGRAPFDVLPQLGGDELLRGYYGGRFRDKSLSALQAEVRQKLPWRFGMVGFGALGQVAPGVADLRLDGMKGAVGTGLRFAINEGEGLNLRADYAWGLGTGTRAFYLSLGEVF
jgi:outer membrane protein assembly factor BamA